ncbi:MAG TPA: DUF917 domain-containing protein [Conexibacter sp.]|nr:DUF917 domain-containing protein [Conexibacter sp.]
MAATSLDAEALSDIARGSAVMAAGGGGDPYLGTLATLAAVERHGPPLLVDPDDVPDDALICSPATFGAPLPFVEKLTFGSELDTAFERLTARIERPLFGLMPIEAGGVNMMTPLLMATRLGLPVVDADLMGRAFPEMALVTLTLYDIGASPAVIADEHGNAVTVEAIDNFWADRLCRAAAIEFGATAAQCAAAITGAQLREAAVLRSVSRARAVGAAVREAAERKRDPVAGLLAATHGFELFRGKIIDVQRRTERSSTFGEVVVEGFGERSRGRLTVKFRNENLVAVMDSGEVLATTPDMITVIDAETGQAITTERLRYGFRVIVFGMAVDAKWRTPRGVELGGPRHFGYDLDYVPVEQLAQRRTPAQAAPAGV